MSTAHPTRRRIRKKSYRALIAGCGDVGGALGRELAADGHQVFGLRRRVAALPEEITPYEADLGRPETLRDLPPALDYVVYAAAADETSEPAYRRAYVEGVDHLLAALGQQHQAPRRLLFTSSTGVYGQSDGSWVDEDSPTEPTRFTGELVLAGERRIAAGPWPATAVRFGGIYGPGRTRLIRRVQAGGLEVDRSRPLYTNRIHRDDCAGSWPISWSGTWRGSRFPRWSSGWTTSPPLATRSTIGWPTAWGCPGPPKRARPRRRPRGASTVAASDAAISGCVRSATRFAFPPFAKAMKPS